MWAAFLLVAATFSSQDADSLVKGGGEKLAQKDFKGAVQDFTRALDLDPKRADAALGRGKAHYKLNSAAEALEDFTRCTVLEPANPEGYYWRGVTYQELEEYRLAIRDFTKCLDLGATNPLLYERRGACLQNLGILEPAEADFSRAIDRTHDLESNYRERGTVRLGLPNLRGAISDLSRAISLDPKNQRLFVSRSIGYFGVQSWENALRDLRRVESSSRVASLWIYLIRCRMGEQDAAAKEIVARLDALPAAETDWARHIVAFMQGELGEAELLKAAGSDATPASARNADAHFFIAQKLLLAGKPEEATIHFRKTKELTKWSTQQHVLSRAEIDFCASEKRRLLLDRLEKRFLALGPCEAHLELAGQNPADAEIFKNVSLYFDMSHARMLVSCRKVNVKEGKEVETFLAFDDAIFTVWGPDGLAQKLDFGPFLSGVKDLDRKLTEEMDRILPPDPAGRAEPDPIVSHLTLNVEGKPDKQHDGSFTFKIARGQNPASWLKEPRSATDAVLHEEGDAVVFDIPSRRKKIVIDARTGFLRSVEARDYDGTTVRKIVVTSFKELAEFPDVKRPEKFTPVPLDFGQLLAQMKEQRGWLNIQISEILNRWERIEKEGKEEQVLSILTRWAARYEDSLHAYAVRTLARRHLQQVLDLGTPPSQLFKDAEGEARKFVERFAKEKAEVAQLLRNQLLDLGYQVETDAYEAPVDNRRHDVLRKILKKAFDCDTVDRMRRETHGDRLESLFREELETHKQL